MSHSQLMLNGRESFSACPLALTMSLSMCVRPFWRLVSSLGFPICFEGAFASALAKLSEKNDFVQER